MSLRLQRAALYLDWAAGAPALAHAHHHFSLAGESYVICLVVKAYRVLKQKDWGEGASFVHPPFGTSGYLPV